MSQKLVREPANPIHPGQMLFEEFLRPAGTSPRLWMNLQATFDLGVAMKKREAA